MTQEKEQPVWAYSLLEMEGVISRLILSGDSPVYKLMLFRGVFRVTDSWGEVHFQVHFETEDNNMHYGICQKMADALCDAGFERDVIDVYANGNLVI